jgi:hypothetical protein
VEGAGRWCEAARLTRSDSSRRMPEWGAIGTFVPGVFPAQPFMETAGIEPAKRSRPSSDHGRLRGYARATLFDARKLLGAVLVLSWFRGEAEH